MSITTERRGILAGGNWIIDHLKVIDAWPQQDALANILEQSWGNGGSPYNILKDLAKLGADFPLEAAGLVGDDADGQRILADLAAHGIDTAQLHRTGQAATSYTDVMTVREGGRRTFFHQRGANALLAPEHFAFATATARIFHLGYLLLLDALDDLVDGVPRAAKVLRSAREAGLRTSVDCVSEDSYRFASVVAPVLPEVDFLFVNDFEAERITGLPLRDMEERIDQPAVETAAKRLLELGVRDSVFIHMPEAAFSLDAGGRGTWQPSLQLPHGFIRGAAGAGDAFAAGVLYALHEGAAPGDALRWGVCTAAASLRHVSCSGGIESLAECLAFSEKFSFQTIDDK